MLHRAISRGLGKDQVAVMVMENWKANAVAAVVDQVSKDSLVGAFGVTPDKGVMLCSSVQ